MRLFKRKNNYYVEVARNQSYPLKTSDHQEAVRLFEIIKSELALLNSYKIIVAEQEKILCDMEDRHIRLMNLLNQAADFSRDTEKRPGSFKTELEFQNHVISRLPEMGISGIEQFKAFENGVTDAIGTHHHGKKIIFEFKLGSIREVYLGQCLRYLKNKKIGADELWLIAEYSNETKIDVFSDFSNIRLFVLSKDYRSKHVIREIKCARFAHNDNLRLIKSNG
jgi:hypothetical protein